MSDQVPEGELDSSSPTDVFSQVMGKEKSGSVRTYGLGVCQSDVWGEVPSSGTSYRMSMEWKSELDKTNQKVEDLMRLLQQSHANGANSSNTPITSPNVPVTSPNQHIASSASIDQQGRVKVNEFNLHFDDLNCCKHFIVPWPCEGIRIGSLCSLKW